MSEAIDAIVDGAGGAGVLMLLHNAGMALGGNWLNWCGCGVIDDMMTMV